MNGVLCQILRWARRTSKGNMRGTLHLHRMCSLESLHLLVGFNIVALAFAKFGILIISSIFYLWNMFLSH